MTRIRIAWLAACLGGCCGPCQMPGSAPAEAPVTPEQVVGHWSGDWGHLVLRTHGDEVWGVYDHDQGTVRGRFESGVLRAWWCEVPSRRPDADAGDVEMHFTRDARGQLALDGRWRYGTTGEWRENWDLTIQPGELPPALLARFDQPDAFCAHP